MRESNNFKEVNPVSVMGNRFREALLWLYYCSVPHLLIRIQWVWLSFSSWAQRTPEIRSRTCLVEQRNSTHERTLKRIVFSRCSERLISRNASTRITVSALQCFLWQRHKFENNFPPSNASREKQKVSSSSFLFTKFPLRIFFFSIGTTSPIQLNLFIYLGPKRELPLAFGGGGRSRRRKYEWKRQKIAFWI